MDKIGECEYKQTLDEAVRKFEKGMDEDKKKLEGVKHILVDNRSNTEVNMADERDIWLRDVSEILIMSPPLSPF